MRIAALPFVAAALVWLAPAVVAQAESRRRVDLQADTLHYDQQQKLWRASGNVVLRVDEAELRGDQLIYNGDREEALLRGHVVLEFDDQHVTTDKPVLYRVRTRTWEAREADLILPPEWFSEGVVEPIYTHAARLEGQRKQVIADRGRLTSCDKPDPHYGIAADQTYVFPEEKLVARKVRFQVLGHTLLTVPRYSISLRPERRRRRTQLIPRFGRNDIEGWFLKTAYLYRTARHDDGTLYVDLMEKRGVGLGVEEDYRFPRSNGLLYLYHLKDKATGGTEIDARWMHQQQFTDRIRGGLNLNMTRNNSFLGTGSTNLNADLTLDRRGDHSTTNFAIRQQRVSGFTDRQSTSSSLRHQQVFGDNFTGRIRADFRKTDIIGGSSADEELNTRVELERKYDKFALLLRHEERHDLDGTGFAGDDFYSSLDRLPELMVRSDSQRLGRDLFGIFPMNVEASWGSFRETPNDVDLSRLYFRANLQNYRRPLNSRVDWNLRGSFTQTAYSDETAQYVVSAFSDLDFRISDQWRANLSYNRQKPAGFTPYRFDFASRYESIDTRVTCQQSDKLMLSLSGGRDMQRNRYRDIIFRLQYNPNETYYASLSTGYDLENSQLRDILLRLSLFSGDRFELDTTTRYSPLTHEISRIRAQLYWQITDKWRIEGISGFNGFTNEFDFNQFRITRDMHCWEAFLTYDQQRRELRFDLALKAFPGLDTRFGVGATGQALDTSAGQIF